MKQREVKFRCARYEQGKWAVYAPTGILEMWLGPQLGYQYMQKDIEEYEKGHLLFLQNTGLKDKNGVDIYEGDIVTDSERAYEVYFGELGLEDYEGIGWILKGIPETDEGNFWLAPDDEKQLEIIGSIYTHPELLTPSTNG